MKKFIVTAILAAASMNVSAFETLGGNVSHSMEDTIATANRILSQFDGFSGDPASSVRYTSENTMTFDYGRDPQWSGFDSAGLEYVLDRACATMQRLRFQDSSFYYPTKSLKVYVEIKETTTGIHVRDTCSSLGLGY